MFSSQTLIVFAALCGQGLTLSVRLGNNVAAFQKWMAMHQKVYASQTEFEQRMATFEANAEIVRAHNAAHHAGHTSFAMSMNGPFADMDDDEFTQAYLMSAAPQNCSATHTASGSVTYSGNPLPKSVDWRTKGVVTPIKDQGHCGSCWTFSTTGCLEAHTCIKEKRDCSTWTGLAEQQLVDCAGNFNNHGCDGGLPSQAYEYVKYNGGLDLEADYPYHATDGNCSFQEKDIGAKVKDVFNITSYDETEISKAVAETGPVSIAFQVAADFRLYDHGVYDSYNATTKKTVCQSDPASVNHAVVVVGYGVTDVVTPTDEPIQFHIIRNSWGNTWGMEGYFWMVKGKNMCGIADCASFPIV